MYRVWLSSGTRLVFFLTAVAVMTAPRFEAATLIGQNRITVDDPRPVKAAVAELERKYRWIITYEDPPFLHLDDLDDLTKPGVSGGKRALTPKRRRLVVELPSGTNAGRRDRRVIQAILDANEASNPSQRFRLLESDFGFHVVPALARDQSGQVTQVAVVLDTRVTIQLTNVPAFDVVNELCLKLSGSGNSRVLIGTIPEGLLRSKRVSITNKNDRARDVLVELLRQLDIPLTWRLLYSPSTPQAYFLNLVEPG
jgi:hypothetical protein